MEFKVFSSIRETSGNIAHLAVERTNKMVRDQQVALRKEEVQDLIALHKWQDKTAKKIKDLNLKVSTTDKKSGVTTEKEASFSEAMEILRKEMEDFLK